MTVLKTAFTTSGINGPGSVELGGIIAVFSAISASAFQPPAAGVVSSGWMTCVGTLGQRTIPSGPLTGAIIPDLSDTRFLQGSTVAWSNPNDTSPTYKSQAPVVNPLTITVGGGTPVPYGTWFAPGNFTPAGTMTTAPISVARAHTHTFAAHSHGVGSYGMAAVFPGSSAYHNSVPTSFTGTDDATVGTVSSSSASGLQKIAMEGTSGPQSGTSGPVGAAADLSHTHTYTGTAESKANFAAPGGYVPTGSVTGWTDRRPVYISCIYMIRVS